VVRRAGDQNNEENSVKKIVAGAMALGMLAGCATQGSGYGANWTPVVDVRPEQQSRYSTDLYECQQYANQVMSAQQAAVGGAVAGAIFGALLGAAAGGNGRFNGQMAGVGALSGGAGAAAQAEGGQRGIIRRCLIGRGYSVLN
jgi:uncharacterized protein YcfJ